MKVLKSDKTKIVSDEQTCGVSLTTIFVEFAFIVDLASIRSFEGCNVVWFMVFEKRL
jgi:hypothetical protein